MSTKVTQSNKSTSNPKRSSNGSVAKTLGLPTPMRSKQIRDLMKLINSKYDENYKVNTVSRDVFPLISKTVHYLAMQIIKNTLEIPLANGAITTFKISQRNF